MAKKSTETLVGVFVLLGILALAFLALKAANLASFSAAKTYTVRARFDNIGGLKKNAPVRSAGVSVGQVQSITLDKNTYQGLVIMKINEISSVMMPRMLSTKRPMVSRRAIHQKVAMRLVSGRKHRIPRS